MPPTELASGIGWIQAYCRMVLAQHGDIKLPRNSDPFVYHGPRGGDISLGSASGQVLTYGIMRSTMHGLLEVLVKELNGREADVDIEDLTVGSSGLVGVCNVTAARSASTVSQNVPIA